MTSTTAGPEHLSPGRMEPDHPEPPALPTWPKLTAEEKRRLIRAALEVVRLNEQYLAERGLLGLKPRTRDEEILSRLD